MIKELLPGDTLRYRWISSGTAPSSFSYLVLDWTETIVDTGTLVSSGAGHFYANYTVPDSEGYYVFKSTVTINSNPYKRSTRFRVIELETD